MTRSGQQRLAAIAPAIARRDEFRERIRKAARDQETLACLMAEAIEMLLDANGLEVVSKDGCKVVCMEEITACHCLVDARMTKLTGREMECLRWASEGKTARETAMILGISPETARWYLRKVREKMDCCRLV